MKTSRTVRLTAAATLVFALWRVDAQETPEPSFKSLAAWPGIDASRLRAIAGEMRFADWPKPKELAVAPTRELSRTLLSRPALVTRETISFHTVGFEGEEWGVARIVWQNLVGSAGAVPQELPAKLREESLQRLTPEQRADPATVDRHLARRLERYRAAQRGRLGGELTIEIALAPSALGAQEFLLARITDNMLPEDALVATYRGAATPEGLGDRGWVTESRSKESIRVELVRRNVVMAVSARGPFVEEALPLARRLDGLVERQPPLTPEQLRSRRPVVTITGEPGAAALRFTASAPERVEVAEALVDVDGRTVRPRDGRIPIAGAGSKAQVRVSVITSELLVGTAKSPAAPER